LRKIHTVTVPHSVFRCLPSMKSATEDTEDTEDTENTEKKRKAN
jgi:hypothetical protein